MIKEHLRLFALAVVLLSTFSCSDKTPEARCAPAGKFVMTLKNEKGRIIQDSASNAFFLHFTTDGGLEYNSIGVPCNLPLDFQMEVNVYFNGDFFEYPADSLGSVPKFSVSIREIDYR